MELRQLKTFKVVGNLLSFNKAAIVLNYAQSTVSAQIKALEEEFGVPLFERLGKKVLLTEAGKKLMQYAGRMIDIESETLTKVSGWEKPNVTITTRVPQSIGSEFLPDILKNTRKKIPGLGLNIIACSRDLLHELRSGIIDIAFLISEGINSKNLKSEVLKIVPVKMAASPDHPVAKKDSVCIEDLKNHSVILPLHDCSYKMTFKKVLTEKQIDARIMEFNSTETIQRFVEKGIGVTIAPDFSVADRIKKGKLKALPISDFDFEFAILMIIHRDKWISPHLEKFMEEARKIMSD